MDNPLTHLCRACHSITAAIRCFPFHTDERCTTFRANIRKHKFRFTAIPFVCHYRYHFRYYFAGFLNHHKITDFDTLFCYKISIVQGSTADGAACQKNRLQIGHRCHRTGTAYLHHNLFDAGNTLLRRELIRNGPARVFGSVAQSLLLCQIIDFNYHAINIEWQIMAMLSPIHTVIADGINITADKRLHHSKARFFQKCGTITVRCRIGTFYVHQCIDKCTQISAGCHFRIQLTNGTGRRIAAVGKQRLTVCFSLCIDFLKGCLWQIYLTAGFQHR